MSRPLTRRAVPLLSVLVCLLATGCGTDAGSTLLLAGDIMLGRTVGDTASSRGDWAFPFRRVQSRLRAAEVTFGNLEGVAVAQATTQFNADPRALEGLQDAGFDVISLANNHTADAGLQALAETAAGLQRLGIAVTGLQYPPAPQNPTIVRAGAIRVGFLAYSWSVGDFVPKDGLPFISRARLADMVVDIARARPQVDYLVVSLHMGTEGARRSSEGQRQKARAAIDAGADLVVAHHPHVPQEVERWGRGLIAYSLGDFVFDHPEVSVDGALLEVTLAAGRPVRVAWMRTQISSELQPEVIGQTVWDGETLRGPNAALN